MRRSIARFCAAATSPIAAAATSAPTTGAEAQQPPAALSDAKREFIEKFRQRLAADPSKADLDNYIEGTDMPVSVSSVGPIKRGHEALPPWLKLKLPKGTTHRPRYNAIRRSMREKKLSTVCEEAKCPNIGECWGGGEEGESATATIMLMGSHCTRGCRFCSVLTSRTPPPLDPEEPIKTADAVSEMGVDYIVLTMVDRDDLPDGGSKHISSCIKAIKEKSPNMLLEALVGDFNGRNDLIAEVASSGLNVFAHNIECVERITPNVRDRRANYRQTLKVLEHASALKLDSSAMGGQTTLFTKSSIMLGLGEREEEIRQCLRDLRTAGVSAVTLGQYLQPSRTRLKVSRYAHPLEFEMWEKEALAMGFLYCASGPMVRSSYRAGEYYIKNILKKQMADAAAAAATLASAEPTITSAAVN